jgi:hypothetical protein
MSRWQDRVVFWITLLAPALLLIPLGIEKIALMTDTVGGILWVVAGLSSVCGGFVAHKGRDHGNRTLVILGIALVVVAVCCVTAALVWDLICKPHR